MNLLKKAITCCVFSLALLPKSGFSQYHHTVEPFFSYLGDIKQYEIGATYIMPFAKFEGSVPRYKGNAWMGDTTAQRSTPGSGIGGSIGLSIPFKATGHISCWAVNWHLMGNMYTWTRLNDQYQVDGGTYKAVNPPLEAATIQVAMPLGIDYKAGNEVIQSRRLAFSTSMGVGVMPSFTMTSLTGADSLKPYKAFGFHPYAKFEVGFLLGINWKFRFMYTLGDVTLLEVKKPTDYRINGPFKVTSNGNFMISLVLMPFSVGWSERAWYNTHDTYNTHDRLN